MPIRFLIAFVFTFFLLADLPALVPEMPGGGSPTGGTLLARTKSKKAGKKKRKRRKKRRRKAKPPRPILPDDPAIPLEEAWNDHLDEFFKLARPIYGAFVAVHPETGTVLALSEFSRNSKKVAHPGTTDAFPAASIFKIVTAAALMEEKKAGPETVTCYHGGTSRLTTYHLSKPPKRRRRCRRLDTAFAHSTNAIFGRLAVELLGADTLLKYAERFGFNQDLLLDGIKTRSRARKARSALDLARMAAGFTNSSLSPLHGALIGAVVANRGTVPLTLVREGSERIIDRATADKLRRMMVKTSTEGTASKYFRSLAKKTGGRVAVKTGSLNSRDGSGRYNTWMVGFYPARRPEIAFGAVISVQGGGPIKAGHLTRYAIDMFHRLKKKRAK